MDKTITVKLKNGKVEARMMVDAVVRTLHLLTQDVPGVLMLYDLVEKCRNGLVEIDETGFEVFKLWDSYKNMEPSMTPLGTSSGLQ